jgi:S-formylglutathione hydrolase FrmB
MLKRPRWPCGTLVTLEHTSKVLADNPLGDPHVRRVAVWLPPQYDEGAAKGLGRRYPVLVDLAGFMGSGLGHIGWKNFTENLPERLDRLVHQKAMAPLMVVFPDCFTALGGNQYVNSSAIGRYADYLTREIVPFVDREFRTLASREHRGCFGKSSGGYGAIVHGMKYPKTWGAVANHSGDAYFDFVYRHDWPNTLTELAKYRDKPVVEGPYNATSMSARTGRGLDDGRVRRFLDKVWRKPRLSLAEGHALMNICMAATYDPDPRAPNGFRLPFNLETGELLDQRWRAWQKHDPINMVAAHAKNLKTLRGLFIDCGWRDQYHIHYGTRLLSKRLRAAGVKHRYEEFDDTHSDIDYRLDVSLPYLSRVVG